MSQKSVKIMIVLFSLLLFSLACNFLANGGSQGSQPGTIKIVNNHIRASDFYPGGKNLPDTREYGICIITYPAPNPPGLTKPTFDMILAKDAQTSQTTSYALPAGTYTVQEFQFDSEVNQDPGYSPAFRTLVRPTETIKVQADVTITFGSDRTLPSPGEFQEGALANSHCNGGMQAGVNPNPAQPTEESNSPSVEEDTPEAAAEKPVPAGGAWVLKLVQPNAGKTETQFTFTGIACTGGTRASSSETSATTTTQGTCQIKGALTANSKTEHSWTRPPDQLIPGEEVSGTLSVSQSGVCSWQDSATEASCRNSARTSHAVWQGDGWPDTAKEFPYSNLVYGNDYAGTARALDNPEGKFKWTIPDGSGGGGKTLVLQFFSTSGGGSVYTNFWYQWADK